MGFTLVCYITQNLYCFIFSEARTYLEFHNLTVFPQRAFVIFAAKDGGNILRDGYIDEVLRFDKLMTTSLADRTKMSERSCHPLCELNRPFHLIMATFLMSIGFVFLLIFVIAVVWRQSTLRVTPFLVTVTLITPFLATISAFGLLSWLKYPIYSMQCVTPFLVLGIGVDDAFILIHRWKHRSDIQDHSVRLTQVIVDVGPSITITSLTNIIAFGVGFFTPTPQMSLFCLATSVALLIDYIVTYTILAPVVYLCSDKKEYQPALPTKPTGNDFLGRYFFQMKFPVLTPAVLSKRTLAMWCFPDYGVLNLSCGSILNEIDFRTGEGFPFGLAAGQESEEDQANLQHLLPGEHLRESSSEHFRRGTGECVQCNKISAMFFFVSALFE
ncbi:patched family protein [Ancylostoma caninum]|uniref:Patched family protein n=1 Tax=Ancylostoma caninum TaxID=29170 RepID=A0A368FAL0_ANCCA|nr:patched family protein [Ancylostoma caninum]